MYGLMATTENEGDEIETRYDLVEGVSLDEETEITWPDAENLGEVSDAILDQGDVAHIYLGGSSVEESGYEDIDLVVEFEDDVNDLEAYKEMKERLNEENIIVRDETKSFTGRYLPTGLEEARLQFSYKGVCGGTPHPTRFDITV